MCEQMQKTETHTTREENMEKSTTTKNMSPWENTQGEVLFCEKRENNHEKKSI